MSEREVARNDERLDRLLEAEQRVEERVRLAREEARARVEAVRARVRTSDEAERAAAQKAACEDERADLERHAAELARIEREGEERACAIASAGDARIEELARKVLARVLAREEGRP